MDETKRGTIKINMKINTCLMTKTGTIRDGNRFHSGGTSPGLISRERLRKIMTRNNGRRTTNNMKMMILFLEIVKKILMNTIGETVKMDEAWKGVRIGINSRTGSRLSLIYFYSACSRRLKFIGFYYGRTWWQNQANVSFVTKVSFFQMNEKSLFSIKQNFPLLVNIAIYRLPYIFWLIVRSRSQSTKNIPNKIGWI